MINILKKIDITKCCHFDRIQWSDPDRMRLDYKILKLLLSFNSISRKKKKKNSNKKKKKERYFSCLVEIFSWRIQDRRGVFDKKISIESDSIHLIASWGCRQNVYTVLTMGYNVCNMAFRCLFTRDELMSAWINRSTASNIGRCSLEKQPTGLCRVSFSPNSFD